MRARKSASQSILLITVLALFGCDRITGADQQKALNAEAIGYACRISLKTPEDCMKENEAQSPTSVLFGWKEADKDVKEKSIDPSMGQHQTQQSAPAATETGGKPAAEKGVEKITEKTTGAKSGIPAAAAAKSEKPATTAATGKPDKDATEKKADH